MAELIVTVNKLNKRSSVPRSLSDKNIVGTVQKGFRFEGTEISNVSDPALGNWYRDRDGFCYWGGGLNLLDPPLGSPITVHGLPANLPVPFRVGIDISHHNSLPDWPTIKSSGVSFIYLKLSEGVGTPDQMAKRNSETAKGLGFKIGYYHFCRPDTRNGGTVINDATNEANEALNRMTMVAAPDLPLVLDLEDQPNWDTPLGQKDYLSWANTFIKRIEDKTGVAPMIYSRKEYLDRKLPREHDLGRCKLWISRYGITDAKKVHCPVGWNDWSMWQYTESGKIGRNAALDINVLKDTSLF
jgi:GH25 family lysozyme M1 (1,4-beta-N-acetylmuramidase)